MTLKHYVYEQIVPSQGKWYLVWAAEFTLHGMFMWQKMSLAQTNVNDKYFEHYNRGSLYIYRFF